HLDRRIDHAERADPDDRRGGRRRRHARHRRMGEPGVARPACARPRRNLQALLPLREDMRAPETSEADIDRKRLTELTAGELDRYRERAPRSAERFARAQDVLLAGVPMSWMLKWAGAFPIEGEAGAFPIFGATAHGSRLVDVDGNEYIDFCIGDTGAMTGHSPEVL